VKESKNKLNCYRSQNIFCVRKKLEILCTRREQIYFRNFWHWSFTDTLLNG